MSQNEVPYITPAQRKRMRLGEPDPRASSASNTLTTTTSLNNATSSSISGETSAFAPPAAPERPTESLVETARRMRLQDEADPIEAARRKREEEEKRVLESAKAATAQALISVAEMATSGKQQRSRERLIRSWTPKRELKDRSNEEAVAIRKEKLIVVDGSDVPSPALTFDELNIPTVLLKYLTETKNIARPTAIQMQGLPTILGGRDLIGVASTGSGKTLTFCLPAVVLSLEKIQDKKNTSWGPNRGPVALLLGPSRELQRQTYQVIKDLSDAVGTNDCNRPQICLAIGGESKSTQLSTHRRLGSHVLVGTPGRVGDYVQQGDFEMKDCTLIVLDEGDRMMDDGFDESVRKILGRISHRRQTLLFSATMPRKVIEFARDALIDPVICNVGRAGSVSRNIVQDVKYTKREERFLELLDALSVTPPPVLVFAGKSGDVDDVHEYLLLKGVRAAGIHGQRAQEERNEAVDKFKAREVDVLVASDVAAKGLDFPSVAHVINFDLPQDVESYVHRVGRTGRGEGNVGLATTFVDKTAEESILIDLAALLVEGKQKVPVFLQPYAPAIPSDHMTGSVLNDDLSCAYCGGIGHRITNCPKVASAGRRNQAKARDNVKGADY